MMIGEEFDEKLMLLFTCNVLFWQIKEYVTDYTQCNNTNNPSETCAEFFNNATNAGQTCKCTLNFELENFDVSLLN